jgi:acetoin utilization protein AcuB
MFGFAANIYGRFVDFVRMSAMRGKLPKVREYMTRLPMEVEQCENVAEALNVMKSHGIRHVPVMSGSHLKGLVSQRDILQAQIEHGDTLDDMPLKDIFQQDVLNVSPDTLVDEVARRMLEQKVGSAVVVDGGFVVGIFTTTDALRVLGAVRTSKLVSFLLLVKAEPARGSRLRTFRQPANLRRQDRRTRFRRVGSR